VCTATSVLLTFIDYRQVQVFYSLFFLFLTYSNLDMNYKLKEDQKSFWGTELLSFLVFSTIGTLLIYFINFLTQELYQLIALITLVAMSLINFFV
jgi:hypothetical protein